MFKIKNAVKDHGVTSTGVPIKTLGVGKVVLQPDLNNKFKTAYDTGMRTAVTDSMSIPDLISTSDKVTLGIVEGIKKGKFSLGYESKSRLITTGSTNI
jgi:hypothetical protein